jgi:hypothetical protein
MITARVAITVMVNLGESRKAGTSAKTASLSRVLEPFLSNPLPRRPRIMHQQPSRSNSTVRRAPSVGLSGFEFDKLR